MPGDFLMVDDWSGDEADEEEDEDMEDKLLARLLLVVNELMFWALFAALSLA